MNRSKLINTAKYAGTSVTLGTAVSQIVMFALPQLKPVSEPITALVIFAVNLLIAWSGLISETESVK